MYSGTLRGKPVAIKRLTCVGCQVLRCTLAPRPPPPRPPCQCRPHQSTACADARLLCTYAWGQAFSRGRGIGGDIDGAGNRVAGQRTPAPQRRAPARVRPPPAGRSGCCFVLGVLAVLMMLSSTTMAVVQYMA